MIQSDSLTIILMAASVTCLKLKLKSVNMHTYQGLYVCMHVCVCVKHACMCMRVSMCVYVCMHVCPWQASNLSSFGTCSHTDRTGGAVLLFRLKTNECLMSTSNAQ